MSLDKRIAHLRSIELTRDLHQWPTKPKVRLEPAVVVDEREVKDMFHCVHGRHYLTLCTKCKRGASEIRERERMYLKFAGQ